MFAHDVIFDQALHDGFAMRPQLFSDLFLDRFDVSFDHLLAQVKLLPVQLSFLDWLFDLFQVRIVFVWFAPA